MPILTVTCFGNLALCFDEKNQIPPGTPCENVWNTAIVVLRGKLISLKACTRKQERLKIDELCVPTKKRIS